LSRLAARAIASVKAIATNTSTSPNRGMIPSSSETDDLARDCQVTARRLLEAGGEGAGECDLQHGGRP